MRKFIAAIVALNFAIPSIAHAQQKDEVESPIEVDIIVDSEQVGEIDEEAIKKSILEILRVESDGFDAAIGKKIAEEIVDRSVRQGEPGKGDRRVIVQFDENRPVDSDRAWLGVQVEKVPAILAKHLKIKAEDSVLIANVVKGSPADHAQIDQYDVVVSLDGKPVKGGSAGFAKDLQSRKQGSKVSLGIVKAGERKTIEISLGKWKTSGVEYKFEAAIPEIFGDHLGVRGGYFLDSIKGIKPLDQFDWQGFEITGLPNVVVGGEPGTHQQSVRKYQKSTNKDGEEVKVEIEFQETNGDKNYTVRKTVKPKGGQETVEEQSFTDEAELKKSFPDAYEYFKKNKGTVRTFQLGNIPGIDKEIKILIDGQVKKQPNRVFELARKNHLHQWEPTQKVDRQFKVDDLGRITVKITKGSSSLETSFKSLEELEKKEPELFEHYKSLLK